MHNNKQRANNPHREHFSKKVADVVIHTFFKRMEEPQLAEGIIEIVKVPFTPGPFISEEDRKAYNMLS